MLPKELVGGKGLRDQIDFEDEGVDIGNCGPVI